MKIILERVKQNLFHFGMFLFLALLTFIVSMILGYIASFLDNLSTPPESAVEQQKGLEDDK